MSKESLALAVEIAYLFMLMGRIDTSNDILTRVMLWEDLV